MNRIIIAGTWMALTVCGSALAATSGTLTLSGTVPQRVDILVNAQSGATTLDLSTSQADYLVATVREKSNSATGYKVSLSSANSGNLVNGRSMISYTAKYNTSGVTLSSTPQTITNVTSQSSPITTTKNFNISYTGADELDLMQGVYSDTLTFSIVAN